MARRCSARSHARGDLVGPDSRRRRVVRHGADRCCGAGQHSAAVHAGAVHAAADGRPARRRGARIPARAWRARCCISCSASPVCRCSPRRRCCRRARPAPRPDRRLPPQLSDRRVRRRLARRAQLRSPLPDVASSRWPCGLAVDFRLRRRLACLVRAAIARRAFGRAPHRARTRSCRPTRSRSRSPRPCSLSVWKLIGR